MKMFSWVQLVRLNLGDLKCYLDFPSNSNGYLLLVFHVIEGLDWCGRCFVVEIRRDDFVYFSRHFVSFSSLFVKLIGIAVLIKSGLHNWRIYWMTLALESSESSGSYNWWKKPKRNFVHTDKGAAYLCSTWH